MIYIAQRYLPADTMRGEDWFDLEGEFTSVEDAEAHLLATAANKREGIIKRGRIVQVCKEVTL